MPWSFPVLSMFRSVFKPPLEPEPDQGPPRPPYPPQIHPNEPGYDYEMHGTYANQQGTSYNVVYWPDFKAWSYHFADGAAKGHSAKRAWYATKDQAIAELQGTN